MAGTLNGPFRSIDGVGNNETNPSWGSAGTDFLRLAPSDYGDGISSPAGAERPGAREISNAVFAQSEDIPSERGTSDLFWVWGQFLDHDIDLTGEAAPGEKESFDILVPAGDPHFTPGSTIPLTRSGASPGTGTDADNPREQVNDITSFIDASMVYGSDPARNAALRDTGGKLKVSEGELLPPNDAGQPNAGGPGGFLAGDVRANENVALTSLHTLFVREHNRQVDELAAEHPELTDEQLYQEAKAIVEAKIQAITYNEFLPLLLGPDALDAYDGYKPDIDPSIANIFATAAFRVGHTMLSSQLHRMDESGAESEHGHLALRHAFFSPDKITDEGGIDPLLRGLAASTSQEIDTHIVDDVRNFLFGPPGAGGFDLASLNMQRGRDHGLPSYNEAREAYGLDPVTSFDEITTDEDVVEALESIYDSVDEIDVFVGGLAEDHVPDAVVGELFHAVLVDQFTRLRDGDRFWYESRFSGEQLEELQDTRLADVIRDNSDVEYIQDEAMLAYNRIGGDEGSEHMSGTWSRDLMMGHGGDDVLKGEKGDDQIYGGDGGDRVYGGVGHDKLEGEAGGDRLLGGDGDDHGHGGDGGDRVFGGAGADVAYGGDGGDHLNGGDGNDMLHGGAGSDRLFGKAGDDSLFGGSESDLLRGGAGNDRLDGGTGTDQLFGDSGDDVLNGGAGADRLIGGSGADRFVFEDILEVGDIISDFNPLEDILDLRPLTSGGAATVQVVDGGYKSDVFLATGGGQQVKVAELWSVDAAELVVGDDAGANILV